jgi:peroxiredoxin
LTRTGDNYPVITHTGARLRGVVHSKRVEWDAFTSLTSGAIAQDLKSKSGAKSGQSTSSKETGKAPGKKRGMNKGKGKAMADAAAQIGEPAPGFTLADANGKEHSLSDYEGKIVVLQWINPKCPVCVRCASNGLVEDMHKNVKKVDDNVVFLAINSTHWMTAKDSAAYLKEHELDVPGLADQDGTVGRLYGARTTPHLFVIDQKGILRYSGAINDDPRGKNDESVNYVVNAVTQITAGETVAPDKTRPYGCSVKYKK